MSHMLNRELAAGFAERKACERGPSGALRRSGWRARGADALFAEPRACTRLGVLVRAVGGAEAQDGVDAPQHEPHAQPRAVSRLARGARWLPSAAAFMQKLRKGV